MAAMIGLIALRQILTLRMGIESEATELPGLMVSVMTFLVVVFLGRLLTERQGAAEALRKSEASLAAAQERAKLGSWELNVATQTSYWSAEMFRLFNYDPARGAPTFAEFLEMVHPDDRHGLEERHVEAGRTVEPFNHEFRSNPTQGPVKTFSASVHTIRNAEGHVVQLAGTVQDITDRKLAEEKLKTHYRELQALQEISQNILNSLDLQLIVKGILDKSLSLGSFDLGVIRLLNSSGTRLDAVASRGYRDAENMPPLSIGPSIPALGKMLMRVVTEKVTQVVENVPEFDGLRKFKKEGVQSAIVVPVLAQGRILRNHPVRQPQTPKV
jgi:PAS domain S-box-containing protein